MSPIAIELTRALAEDGSGPAVGAIGVGVFSDALAAGEAPAGIDAAFLAAQGFTAKAGEACVVPGAGGRLDVALGLGPAADVTTATYRKAAARLARAAPRCPHVAIDLLGAVPEHLNRPDVAQALAEGVVLGAYRYTALKSDPEPSHLESLVVVGPGGAKVRAALDRGRTVAEAVCLARNLCTPSRRPAGAGRGEARPAGGAFGAVLDRAGLRESGPLTRFLRM